jgi:hypothetical protein
MNLIQKTTVAAVFLACSTSMKAQEITFTQGGETTTSLKKQSTLENFSINGNSHYVTSYMESATLVY